VARPPVEGTETDRRTQDEDAEEHDDRAFFDKCGETLQQG
jgi:hypothetical protein